MITFIEIKNTWQDIEKTLEEKFPKLNFTLNKGASISEIEIFEKYLGYKLPLEFKFSYMVHNGQNYGNGLFGHERLLTLEEIIQNHRMMTLEFGDEQDYPKSDNYPNQFKWRAWHQKWIRFTEFECDGFVLDMTPEPKGFTGQIFYRHNVQFRENISSKSFYDWLIYYKELIKTDKVYLDEYGELELDDWLNYETI